MNETGTYLALVYFMESSNLGAISRSLGLHALIVLSRLKGLGDIKPTWSMMVEHPESIYQLVSWCVANNKIQSVRGSRKKREMHMHNQAIRESYPLVNK